MFKRNKRKPNKVKTYAGRKLFENSRLKIYFNKYNFGLSIFVDRSDMAVQIAFITIFIKREVNR